MGPPTLSTYRSTGPSVLDHLMTWIHRIVPGTVDPLAWSRWRRRCTDTAPCMTGAKSISWVATTLYDRTLQLRRTSQQRGARRRHRNVAARVRVKSIPGPAGSPSYTGSRASPNGSTLTGTTVDPV